MFRPPINYGIYTPPQSKVSELNVPARTLRTVDIRKVAPLSYLSYLPLPKRFFHLIQRLNQIIQHRFLTRFDLYAGHHPR